MLTIYILGCIMLHFIVGGFAYSRVQARYRPICKYRNTKQCDSECGHSMLAGVSIVLWPIIFPVMLGISVGEGKGGASRDEKRRAKEIAEANHKKELARIAMEEDAMLTHQLAAVKNRNY